ncbi:MAG: type 1 glutamine amidotransferase [Chlorobi bacterium]|nr:type 1 glutamine amidotransferase [Chlorobiota bacterium]
MSLRIHYFQHVPFEGPGYIEQWALNNGHKLSSTHFYKGDKLPGIDDFDWLVIMGGSMNIFDKNLLWLNEEKEFLKKTIDAGKSVVGVCLGAQLIAHVLGADVYANDEKEIGWWPVKLTKEGKKHPLLTGIPDEFSTFHWHGDTFDTPEGAVHLMSSDVCRNQAFLYKEKVLALQFHFETTKYSVKEIVANCRDELVKAPHIQTEEQILSQADYLIPDNNKHLEMILDRLAGKK